MFDVVIIGAGISGLTAAVQCRAAGLEVVVIEATESIGGRVRSAMHDGTYAGDLGPSWVWPPWQSAVVRWLTELGIEPFPQFDEGMGLLDFPGQLQRHSLPGQHGIVRLTGGPQSIVVKLADRLADKTIRCGVPVRKLFSRPDCIEVHLQSAIDEPAIGGNSNSILQARQVILAVPMRVALENIQFEPALPQALQVQMAETPTWMATQVKIVALYPTAFWREQGLSGRVASRVGPLVEIHDHCGSEGLPAALFGFMGLTFEQRQQYRDTLSSLVIEQLRRCFGDQANAPSDVWIEDWALANTVCAESDRMGEAQHPVLRPDSLRQVLMNGRLHFASAELATESPGLIDGALSAGEMTAEAVLKNTP